MFPVSLYDPHLHWIPQARVSVAELCLTLCDPLDCNPPASSVNGILQARIVEWVTIHFSRGCFWPRDWTQVSCIAGRVFTIWATRETPSQKLGIIVESSHLFCTPFSQVNIPVVSAFKILQCACFCFCISANCHKLHPGKLSQPPNWQPYTCLCFIFLCPQLQPICHTTP